MSPESLKIIAAANAALAGVIQQASGNSLGHSNADDVLPAIEAQLPAIAATIEEAGRAIEPLTLSANLDPESSAQIDLYAQNLRTLKTLLSPLLASAEARRKRLREKTGKVRETLSWLSTLKSTGMD
ncbi:MAG: hypothetical protein M1423_05900 [Acidobacteria bacterium]|nr:hypothetical protein [Acidobacteriota bacterium]